MVFAVQVDRDSVSDDADYVSSAECLVVDGTALADLVQFSLGDTHVLGCAVEFDELG